jgi:membrane protein
MQSFLSRISTALQPTPAGRFLLDIVRAALTVIRGFRGERISLRASALTYLSIFSLVPMVTVALALVRSLGGHKLADSVYNFAYGVLAPGIRDDYAQAPASPPRAGSAWRHSW